MKYILAIDQSTSATKALLFDREGRLLDRESLEHRQIYPKPGWVEHDAEEIWRNVQAVLGALATRNVAKMADTIGLAITNQRETILVFDKATGAPLHNAIVWQCRRGDPLCAELCEAGHTDAIRAKTGLMLDTYFSGSKLMWLVRNKPEIAAKLRDGSALIGTIDAYLVHRLTGGAVFATDHTNASRTLLYDLGAMRWDEELCGLFEAPAAALPEVRESFARYGEVAVPIEGLPAALPICGILGDSQASLFAQRCYEPGMAKATFGTGTSVLLNIGGTFRLSEQGAVSALAWVWQGRPVFALEGLINYSSATIAWLRDQLGLISDASETEALARSVENNGGVYLVPAFAGLSAPWWSNDARAAVVGMSAHTTKAHIVRAALEAIAYQIRDVLEMLRADSGGVEPAAIFGDGGPTRNGFLMQFTSDLTRKEIVVAETPESSALGAATAGLLGLGEHKTLDDIAALPRETRTFTPQMPEGEAECLYAGWKNAVKRVL